MAEKLIQLAIDLDEVVFDYVGGVREYGKTKGVILPDSEPSHFSMTESGWFKTMDDFHDFHKGAVVDNIYQNLKVIEGASETLHDLSDSGYGINILTSRFVIPKQHNLVVTQTVNALDAFNIPYSNITFSNEKWRHRYDAYFEDAPHNLIPLQENGLYTVVFDRLWNKSVTGDRAKDWKEFRKILGEKFGK